MASPWGRCVGLCVNTAKLEEDAARALLAELAEEHGLPATDPVRFGSAPVVDEIARIYGRP